MFYNNTHCTHSTDHAVPTNVKWQRGLGHIALRRRRACRQEPRHQPFGQLFIGDVIRTDHDDSLAASHSNPVLCESQTKRCGRTGGVDRDIGTTGPNQLGQLSVSHRQHFQKKLAIKTKGFRIVRLLLQICDQAVISWECTREDNPRLVPHGLRQRPPRWQLFAGRRGFPGADHGNVRIPQGFDACCNRQLRRDVIRLCDIGIDAVVAHQIERTATTHQVDRVILATDGFK